MDKIRLCFLGDISLSNSLYKDFIDKKVLIQNDLVNYINDSNIIIGNFEFAIINEKKQKHLFSRERFYSKVEHLEIIKNINWTFFTIANNHISDWGCDNLKLTKTALREISEYEPIGAGLNELDALNPLIININGRKIGFLAFSEKKINNASKKSFGSAPFKKDLLKNLIIELKKKTDFVISIVHWGSEYIPYPSPEQRKIAEFLSNYGVNIIIGSHPHILQGYEKIGDSEVFYSLGNFIADLTLDYKPEEKAYELGHYSFILKVIIDNTNKIKFEKKFIKIDEVTHSISFITGEELKKSKIGFY